MEKLSAIILHPFAMSINPILLTSNVSTNVGVEEVGGMAKIVQEYGVTTVCCVLLIIFAAIMFREILDRYRKTDDELLKSLNDALSTIENIKNSNVNVAGCFDKHNMKATLEFENVKRELEDIVELIEDSNKESELLRKTLEEVKEQNERLQKMLDKQMSIIAQLSQSINQQNTNKNTMSR